jgi:hypothetical protein
MEIESILEGVREESLKEGEIKGEINSRKEVALKMLELKYPIDLIKVISDLSIKEIKLKF